MMCLKAGEVRMVVELSWGCGIYVIVAFEHYFLQV